MDTILELNNVTKIYSSRRVVNEASFRIERGKVYGLLGPNGAGKTTTMKIIMNQIKCEEGNVDYSENLKIRYLQDVPEFYNFYTVNEYLNFVLDINHYTQSKEYRIKEVLEALKLNDYENVQIKKLSRGLKQKVGIASVIIDDADLLILDEPVSALDPIGRKEMFDIINSLKGHTAVIFSSHILTDIERVCDHVLMINNGKIILDSEIEALSLDSKAMLVEFTNKEDLLKVKESIKEESLFDEKIENCLEIKTDDYGATQKEIFDILSKNKITIFKLSQKEENLEQIFLREVSKNA